MHFTVVFLSFQAFVQVHWSDRKYENNMFALNSDSAVYPVGGTCDLKIYSLPVYVYVGGDPVINWWVR